MKAYYIKQYIDFAKAIKRNFSPFLLSKIKRLVQNWTYLLPNKLTWLDTQYLSTAQF